MARLPSGGASALKGASPRQYGHLLDVFSAGGYREFVEAGGRPLRLRPARALALAALRPGLDVIDIGCGRGEVALHAARRGCRVTALDFSLEGLAMTKEVAGLGPPDGVRLIACGADALPLAAGSADRVLLLDIVEHLTQAAEARCLDEVRRILRPSGRVVIHTLPNRQALATYAAVAPFVRGLPRDPRSGYERIVHVNEHSPRDLSAALHNAGFDCRVWVEEWTSRYAARSAGRTFPDRPRRQGYPTLAGPWARRMGRLLMATPLASWVGNDVFAVAWRAGDPPPPSGGKMARLL